jgi:hypothetical protein
MKVPDFHQDFFEKLKTQDTAALRLEAVLK